MRLHATALCQTFGGVRALDNVEIILEAGDVVGVVGPNGCGKTTLVDALTGVRTPESGHVEVNGRDLTGRAPAAFARAGVSRTFQATRLLESLDAVSNVMLGLHVGGPWRRAARSAGARSALDRVGIKHLATRRVRELSHGQRRRVELARAVVGNPEILILDEPTAGLFPDDARDVVRLLRELSTGRAAILMVEHDLGVVARACNRVVVMDEGRVLDDGPAAAVLSSAALRRLDGAIGTDRLLDVPA